MAIYRRKLQLGSRAPHLDIEIHDVVLLSICALLLLQQIWVDAVDVRYDYPQFLDICRLKSALII